jgi:hypothetical protein
LQTSETRQRTTQWKRTLSESKRAPGAGSTTSSSAAAACHAATRQVSTHSSKIPDRARWYLLGSLGRFLDLVLLRRLRARAKHVAASSLRTKKQDSARGQAGNKQDSPAVAQTTSQGCDPWSDCTHLRYQRAASHSEQQQRKSEPTSARHLKQTGEGQDKGKPDRTIVAFALAAANLALLCVCIRSAKPPRGRPTKRMM